ncbi:MAG: calcium/sodium antiporter [Deltaproteobacteria bacterium]|jgi:cation:H+ antiporter|nr:calcium/sodium antiporter [Deltaproteobacteria bacterium]
MEIKRFFLERVYMILNIVLFAAGFLLLYYGANWLVKGSSSLARNLGLTPLVIGLTVVAFGTSAPELVVSVVSSIKGKSMIALGNVVGSNICNIALVLALASIIHPIKSQRSVFHRDIPIMLGISLYLFLISLNSEISRLEGASLFGGIILYTCFNYYIAVKESRRALIGESVAFAHAVEEIEYVPSRTRQMVWISAGIVGVVVGAEILINAAVAIMKIFAVSEKFIGLTIVALGTSLPELATSVVAAFRKEMDISIGNLVGSNVFNILSVLGAAALVRPIPIPGGFVQSGLLFDYIAMMFVSFLPWLMMRKTYVVSRKDGVVLLACYVGYIVYLILKS